MKTEKPRKAVKGVLGQKMCGRPGTARSYRAKEYLQSEEKKKVKRKKKQKKKSIFTESRSHSYKLCH